MAALFTHPMSFDLAVWHGTRALSTEEAAGIHEALCEGRALPSAAGVTASPSVDAFLAALHARYPNLDSLPEDAVDASPWASGFEASDHHVLLNFRWGSASDEAVAAAVDLARSHGLVLFDPQGPQVHLPPALRPAASRWQFWRR